MYWIFEQFCYHLPGGSMEMQWFKYLGINLWFTATASFEEVVCQVQNWPFFTAGLHNGFLSIHVPLCSIWLFKIARLKNTVEPLFKDTSEIRTPYLIRTPGRLPTLYKYILFSPWNKDTSLIRTVILVSRVSVLERFHWIHTILSHHGFPCISRNRLHHMFWVVTRSVTGIVSIEWPLTFLRCRSL